MEAGGNAEGGSLGDIPTRPMRVKVLYTFDTDAKTTCLARLPDTQNIPVVAIDEQSQVGVINLHQCIQAIVSASPEILSKLDTGDFTVYNFDFTELDTPIVGQGRLSALLAGTPSGQNTAMITGRVCRNIQALFSNGIKEILEVKFKLTPLSRPAQNDFASNANALRSVSPAMSGGFDPNTWSASTQQNRPSQQINEYYSFDAMASGADNGDALLEEIFDMGSTGGGDVINTQHTEGVGMTETPTDSTFAFNPAFMAHSHSAPGSRAGSPIMRSGSNTFNEHIRHQSFSTQPSNLADLSRPASRASVRSETNSTQPQRQAPIQPYQQPQAQQPAETFYNEDGQARKRAKVTQTDWRGKTSFGSKSSNLRVTAATASSMHMFRPIAKRPSAPGADLEPPPRVPTPVPKRTIAPRQRSQPSVASRSMLRQASTFSSDIYSDNERLPDTESSPEGSSPARSVTAEFTPMDFPSSPPLVPGYNQPTPGSPALPTSTKMVDSGYMSERGFNSEMVMESLEGGENTSPDASDFALAPQYHSQHIREDTLVKIEGSGNEHARLYRNNDHQIDLDNAQMEEPGDMSLLPSKRMRKTPPGRRGGNQGTRPNPPPVDTLDHSMSATSPLDERTPLPGAAESRRNSLALPPKHPTRSSSREQSIKAPARQARRPFYRSRTVNDSEAGSPAPSDTEGRPRSTVPSGSGKTRRQIIEERLQQAIANGEMPLYCSHCGAVETPTWRRLYTKSCDGKPGPLDFAEGEGESIGIEPIEIDPETGETTRFLIRKSMKKTKESQPGKGFEETVVCNPCGLWFTKYRKMRPEDKWQKRTATRRTKSRGDDHFGTDGAEPRSEAFFTDQMVPEDAIYDGNSADDTQIGNDAANESIPMVKQRRRANSMQPQPFRRSSEGNTNNASRQAALMRREVQSSPVRSQGSQDSPIEVDLTPAPPTRRLLFPSPRQEGEVKSLEGSLTRNFASPEKSSCDDLSGKIANGDSEINISIYKAITTNKENMAPPLDADDDLRHLFEGSPSILKTPLPKTPAKRTPYSQKRCGESFQTPTQSSRKRQALASDQNAANNANINDFMTSPGSTRYFLRSTPSRLERTPGGRSVSGGSRGFAVEQSPFSRHLAQMLSDANGTGEAPFTSPSRQYDFSDLPTFTTPGRDAIWKGLDDILSSEFANYDDNGGTSFHSKETNDK